MLLPVYSFSSYPQPHLGSVSSIHPTTTYHCHAEKSLSTTVHIYIQKIDKPNRACVYTGCRFYLHDTFYTNARALSYERRFIDGQENQTASLTIDCCSSSTSIYIHVHAYTYTYIYTELLSISRSFVIERQWQHITRGWNRDGKTAVCASVRKKKRRNSIKGTASVYNRDYVYMYVCMCVYGSETRRGHGFIRIEEIFRFTFPSSKSRLVCNGRSRGLYNW